MQVTFIDVGYGDAVLFQTGNYTMLLDGGSNLPQEFEGDAYRIRGVDFLRKHNIDHIDAVFISHIHEDHVCGLEPILAEIPADKFYTPYPIDPFLKGYDVQPSANAARSVPLYTNALNAYRHILKKAVEEQKQIQMVQPGDTVILAKELSVKVLAPRKAKLDAYMELVERVYQCESGSDEVTELLTQMDSTSNATSLLLRVEIENNIFLMAADSCPREWEEVPSSLLENVNVLKLPHHGQIDSIKEEYMGCMNLEYVVTTASSDRRYNSANPEVFQRFTDLYGQEKAPKYLFTDERIYEPYFAEPNGFHAIVFSADEKKLKYQTIY